MTSAVDRLRAWPGLDRPPFVLDRTRLPVVATSIVVFTAARAALGPSPPLALAIGLWIGYCVAYVGVCAIEPRRGIGARLAIVALAIVGAGSGRVTEIALATGGAPALADQATRLAVHLAFVGLLIAVPLVQARNALRRRTSDEAERARLQSRLLALQAQIEPHFLFNTLATMRALMRKDTAAAVELLDRMTSFLRAVLPDIRQGHSTVAREVAIVESYLAIMQSRLGHRLSYTVRVDPDSASAPLAPLLLQPLVENAVRHGIERCETGGEVQLSAAIDGTFLVVEVRNTGDLPAEAERARGTGLGLANVRDRIAVLYGAGGSLSLRPAAAGITVATLRVPRSDA